MFFDSHSHYYDARFAREYEGGADVLLKELFATTLDRAINVGTNPETNAAAIAQAARFPGLFAAVGIHPEDCHYLMGAPENHVADLAAKLTDPAGRRASKIVAIGEIGLDYHYENYGEIPLDKAREAAFFDLQLELAEQLDLPVIIHDREAHGDCFDAILRHKKVRGVFHSFSGSPELAHELTRRGWYVSFSGTVSFKNARRVKEAVAAVPRELLLIETDCPYLAPHPHRGELNHSGLLPYTAAAIGEVIGSTVGEVAALTAANARRLFDIL